MADATLKLLVLKTHDVDAACRFYGSIGLEFTPEQHGSGPLHYAANVGDIILEIYPLPADQPVDCTTRLGFAVADPDAAADTAAAQGGRLVKPGRQTAWGYVAIVADPDGRTVELYGP